MSKSVQTWSTPSNRSVAEAFSARKYRISRRLSCWWQMPTVQYGTLGHEQGRHRRRSRIHPAMRVGSANAIRHHPPRQSVPFSAQIRRRPSAADQSCTRLKPESSEIWPMQLAQDKPLPRKENSPPSELASHRQPIANRPRRLRPNRCRPSQAPAPVRRRQTPSFQAVL